jgi:hypothetical protein
MVSTNFGDETHVMRSIEAGAAGYLLGDSSPSRMTDEIRSLASGGSPIGPIIARQVLARFRNAHHSGRHQRGQRRCATAAVPAREGSAGLHHQGIYRARNCRSDAAVAFHRADFVRRIYSKLKVSSKPKPSSKRAHPGLLP